MYSTSHREVGEHSDRVRLEVKAEFFGRHPEGQSSLLETGISSFSDRDLLMKNMGFYCQCSSS